MPGLFGFSLNGTGREQSLQAVAAMQEMMTHGPNNRGDDVFADESVAAGRVHIGVIQTAPQPTRHSGVHVWLDGEFYNQDQLMPCPRPTFPSDADLLAVLYEADPTLSFLKHIDGFYAAVIYDTTRGLLHLVTDRYGLRHLYWAQHGGRLAWASEIKAFLELPGFTPIIDQQALGDFFSVGYLLENRTWFDGVELAPPGSVLTWNLKTTNLQTIQYWWWSDIKLLQGSLHEPDLAEELGRRFVAAVEKRSIGGNEVGVSLSGGLDSRAILAALPDQEYPIHAVTFGSSGCLDIEIAAQVAQVKGAIHHIYRIDGSNWLTHRLEGVWRTDGMLNLMHMHSNVVGSTPYHVNLNGFLGDVTLGGSYLRRLGFLDQPINRQLAAEFLCVPEEYVPENLSTYRGVEKSDVFGIVNKGRRFIALGLRNAMCLREQRLPFFDNDLIELSYAIPDTLRYQSRLYNAMLLRFFPRYYQTIPWQKTGAPITLSHRILGKRFVAKVARRGLDYLGLRNLSGRVRNFADYPNWIRREPARSFFQEMLVSQNALYPEYLPREQVIEDLGRHMVGGNRANVLCQYLTFELWLQQVFESRYRYQGREKHSRSIAVRDPVGSAS